jgi:hypothetical protein
VSDNHVKTFAKDKCLGVVEMDQMGLEVRRAVERERERQWEICNVVIPTLY